MSGRWLILLASLMIGVASMPDSCCAAETVSILIGAPQSIVFPLMAPTLSSKFGMRKHPIYRLHKNHAGVDLAAPIGSHVRAVADGIVVFADRYKGYGKLVTISHPNGAVSLYGHLNVLSVNPGDRINAGELIGRVGNSGDSTGPHLHFEWRVNDKPVDPLKIFPYLASQPEG